MATPHETLPFSSVHTACVVKSSSSSSSRPLSFPRGGLPLFIWFRVSEASLLSEARPHAHLTPSWFIGCA